MSAITKLFFRTCQILYLIWKRTWTKIWDAPSFTIRMSERFQNHYNFCKYYFLNLFEARQTNLINKMCFLLRIFNYGIICSNNKIFLDAPPHNKKYFLSLSLSPNVTSLPSWGLLPASLPDLNCSQVWPRPGRWLWLVSRPACLSRSASPRSGGASSRESPGQLRLEVLLRTGETGRDEVGERRGRERPLAHQAGPDIALNLIKENLKPFRPFRVFYYLMTLIVE